MIKYSTELNSGANLYALYDSLGWNDYLKLSQPQIIKAMEQSWYVLYAYDGDMLVGTGRVVSDGIMNAYLCGLGVDQKYRHQGIGTAIVNEVVKHCKGHNLHIQFFCEEDLVPFYRKLGFDVFAMGMKFGI